MEKKRHEKNIARAKQLKDQKKEQERFKEMLDSRDKERLLDDIPIYNGFYK